MHRPRLSRLTIINDLDDPTTYSPRIKSLIVFTVAVAATNGPLSCGIVFPALSSLELDLNVSATIASLSVSLFLLGMGISPLWLSYISEHYGRRPVYISTFTLFLLFTILSGFSSSISMFLVFRLLAALCSGSAQALGAGTISDIYEPRDRGTAMGYFYLGPLVGPVTAPIIGGALVANGSIGAWRNTQWFLAAMVCISLLLLVFTLPETLAPTGPRPPKRKLLLEPLKTFSFLRLPGVACSIFFASTNFGLLYVMNISIEYGFRHAPYNYKPIVIGLLYLGNSLGYWIGSIIGGKWCDIIMRNAAIDGEYIPERRIGMNVWTGAVLVPSGLLLYGWTINYGITFIVPLIGTFLFGLGTMFEFSAVTTYLVDSIPGRSSSSMALNNFVRNVLACIGSFVAIPLIDKLGYGILFSIVAGILIASMGLVLLIVIYGDTWREKAKSEEMAKSEESM